MLTWRQKQVGMIGFLFVVIHSKMQGAVTVALTVAFTRTHDLAMQVTARDAMLQQAELSYAILSLMCTE